MHNAHAQPVARWFQNHWAAKLMHSICVALKLLPCHNHHLHARFKQNTISSTIALQRWTFRRSAVFNWPNCQWTVFNTIVRVFVLTETGTFDWKNLKSAIDVNRSQLLIIDKLLIKPSVKYGISFVSKEIYILYYFNMFLHCFFNGQPKIYFNMNAAIRSSKRRLNAS